MVQSRVIFCLSLLHALTVVTSNLYCDSFDQPKHNEITFIKSQSPDSLEVFKNALIAFRQIMETRIKDEQEEQIGFRISERAILKTTKFDKVIEYAEKLVNVYHIILSERDDYLEEAKNYRLLQWLRYTLRRDNQPNQSLENIIDKLISLFWNFYNLAKEDGFLKAVSYKWNTDNENHQICTFEELKKFLDNPQDQIVKFCLFIGTRNREAANDLQHNMPFYDKVELYENLIKDAGIYEKNFNSFFRMDPKCMLAFIYMGIQIRLQLPYHLDAGTGIDLRQRLNDPIQDICHIMIVFDRAMKDLFNEVQIQDEIPSDAVLRIENFYDHMKTLDNSRTKPLSDSDDDQLIKNNRVEALLEMVRATVQSYDDHIAAKEFHGRWSDEFKAYYGRLLGWLAAYIKELRGDGEDLYADLKKLRRNYRSGRDLEIEDSGIRITESAYLQVYTLSNLISFYKIGNKFYQSISQLMDID